VLFSLHPDSSKEDVILIYKLITDGLLSKNEKSCFVTTASS
jgi:hypothetical protein